MFMGMLLLCAMCKICFHSMCCCSAFSGRVSILLMRNLYCILKYIDTIHSCIQLNPTLESSNSVNFLDLSITRNPTHLNIGLYRKPTTIDTTINFLYNHPLEHRMAAYNFYRERGNKKNTSCQTCPWEAYVLMKGCIIHTRARMRARTHTHSLHRSHIHSVKV